MSRYQLAAGRRKELSAEEIAIDHHRWVEVGDRGKSTDLYAKSCMGLKQILKLFRHVSKYIMIPIPKYRFEANQAKVF